MSLKPWLATKSTGVSMDFAERETGLEPAASSLEGSGYVFGGHKCHIDLSTSDSLLRTILDEY